MKQHITFTKECPVYPGEYIPLPEIEVLLDELSNTYKQHASMPLVNMNEYKDCFKIAIAVPGVRREDIFVHSHDNILSVVVLHEDGNQVKNENQQIHEFESECLVRNITLPGNTDNEFILAEYNQGILNLHLPKTPLPSNTNPIQIVVY